MKYLRKSFSDRKPKQNSDHITSRLQSQVQRLMFPASNVAEKAVGVTVEDIRGNCPQNMVLLAIFGDTASVEAALGEIKRKEKEGTPEW